jgi:hypothetical protein
MRFARQSRYLVFFDPLEPFRVAELLCNALSANEGARSKELASNRGAVLLEAGSLNP